MFSHRGWVEYATSIFAVFQREIIDWRVTNHMRKFLAGDALTMDLAMKYRHGRDLPELIQHSNQGV